MNYLVRSEILSLSGCIIFYWKIFFFSIISGSGTGFQMTGQRNASVCAHWHLALLNFCSFDSQVQLVYVSNKGLSILLFHLLSAFYPLATSRISLAIICGFCNLANLVISKHYHLQKRKEKDASVALRWTLPLGRVVYLRPHSGTIQFSLCVESASDTESDRWIHTIFN